MTGMPVQPQTTTTKRSAALANVADQPNIAEVSGTSFPLLTTVLAGFAVTIAVQLIIRPDAAADLPMRVVAAIIIFLASTLVFISSIVFAVNAQAHSYLPFLDLNSDAAQEFGVEERSRWIGWLHQGWNAFHIAAVVTFYGGIFLLLAGVNLIVWEFVGSGVALAVLLLILANVALTMAVSLMIHRRKQHDNPLARPQEIASDSNQEEGTADKAIAG